MPSFYLPHLFKDPLQVQSPPEVLGGSGLQHVNFRDTVQPMTPSKLLTHSRGRWFQHVCKALVRAVRCPRWTFGERRD